MRIDSRVVCKNYILKPTIENVATRIKGLKASANYVGDKLFTWNENADMVR